MKYLLAFVLTAIACNALGQSKKQYKIGDSAFCGIVFHVQTDSGRQRVLVCSVKDQAVSIPWYNGKFVSTFDTIDILYDKANADKIIKAQGSGNYAALLCRNVMSGNSTCMLNDSMWYLPSKAELRLIYQNLDSLKGLHFAREGYWTSVEFSTAGASLKKPEKKAWIVDFFNGKTFAVIKSNKYHIRAVREFTN